jgi:hypothetical protein
MGILAVYDTTGIQSYIFSSNKLAENVGGSKLVADIFSKKLPEVIETVTRQPRIDRRKGDVLNPELNAEIIYEGGGNAFVAFRDEQTFQSVTQKFLTGVSVNAPGIGIAVAAIETDFGDTYKSDFEILGKRLSLVKGGFNTPAFAGNQPITKQSARTGLPVSEFRDDEYLSVSQVKKRERYDTYKKTELKEKQKKEMASKIDDFSDLAFNKGTDSLIAIIHADGNNMGSRIKTFMDGFESYSEAVPAIRGLSARIDACYKTARNRTIEAFRAAYGKYIEEQKLKYPAKAAEYDKKKEPPILELIGDGDDTTLAIGGRFALDFAARLLREIEYTPADKRPFADCVPTACAGVVLFHDHYPFSKAYKLAEESCASAKKPSRKAEGSYIDFHLHQSGNVSGLSELRKWQYTVDGKSILCRPWLVSKSESNTTPSFRWFEENIESFKKMPRNKTKALRNAIGAGETAADIADNQMRETVLPPKPLDMSRYEETRKTNISEYAPYFDILEFYDAYENLLNKEDADNA